MTASITDSDSLCEVGVLNLRMLPSARVCVCDVVAVLFPAPAGYPQTGPVKTIQGKATRQIGQSALRVAGHHVAGEMAAIKGRIAWLACAEQTADGKGPTHHVSRSIPASDDARLIHLWRFPSRTRKHN